MAFSCLLITNQPDFQILIKQCVKNVVPDAEVTICRSYEEAFAYLFYKEWDLILVDYLLRDGLETLKRARQISTNPNSTLILFSSPHTEAVREEAKKLGADAILSHEEVISKKAMREIISRNNAVEVSELLN